MNTTKGMPIQFLIDYYGSKANIAKALGLTRATVTLWGDGDVPEKIIGRLVLRDMRCFRAWQKSLKE